MKIDIIPINKKLMKRIFKPTVGEFDTKPLKTKNNIPIDVAKYENILSLRVNRIYPISIRRYRTLSNIIKGNVGKNLAAYTK